MTTPLQPRDKALITTYAGAALVALVGTQLALVRHVRNGGGIGSFVTDPVDTAAGTFLTIDLLAVALVALVFVVAEGRRLGMRHLWVYVVLAFAVAISVAFPAFLAFRQVHLARRRG